MRGTKAVKAAINFSSAQVNKRPIFFYCIAILAIVWVVGLVTVELQLLQGAWPPVNEWQVRMIACNILGFITALTLFPVAVYIAFNRLEKRNAYEQTMSELDHYGMRKKVLVNEIKRCFQTVYDPRTYRIPIVLATLSIMIGWILFFYSQGSGLDYGMFKDLMDGRIQTVFEQLRTAHPVVFGFLGAFFYSLQILFQRYVTRDLKAAVFMHIAVRIWIAIILTMVIGVVAPIVSQNGTEGSNLLKIVGEITSLVSQNGTRAFHPSVLAVSFLIGIFPRVGLEIIKRTARRYGIKAGLASPKLPLDKIRGLNLWQQSRLLEEDIDSVQNLAMSDVIGLIANTRLGIMKILHWVDQALLIVHAGEDDLNKFHRAGIYTATDFEAIYAGRLAVSGKLQSIRKLEKELESYMGREGPSHVPEAPQGLIKSLREEEGEERTNNELTEEMKERVRNIMIAVCDDVNFQRLWKIRRGKLSL